MSFLKSFCSGGKSDFADMIPDKLTFEHFEIHKTFRHGLPNQPSCLAYDCVQELLAVGSHKGVVAILGKAGLEKHFIHPDSAAIQQMIFIENKGLLVTRCSNNTLYQWDIRDKHPKIAQMLEFKAECPCLIAWPYSPENKWLYVGMDGGSVNVIDLEKMDFTSYVIHWDKVVEVRGYQKNRPGKMVALAEQPNDSGKLLLAYDSGICVLWNMKAKAVEKKFNVRGNIILSVSWNANGKQFAVGCSDGSVLIFQIKGDGSAERTVIPHGSQPSSSPVIQVQWHAVKPEPILLFTGGFPEGRVQHSRHLTFSNSRCTDLLSFPDPIVSFLCLPSSPFATDTQKDVAVVILTETELAFHDLQSSMAPFVPTHALSFGSTAVTSVQFCGNCPDTFVSQLYHIHSKQEGDWSQQPWPMRGGAWGDELPDSWTDLLVTGHSNGAVKLWSARSVVFQPLFTILTTEYFTKKSGGSQSNTRLGSSGSTHSSPSTGQPKKPLTPTVVNRATMEPAGLGTGSSGREDDDDEDAFTKQLFGHYQQTVVEDDDYFAICLIELDVHSQTLCVSNCGGHTLVFDLSAASSGRMPQSLTVNFTEDSALREEHHGAMVARYLSPDCWTYLPSPSTSSLLDVVQHCHCYYIEGTLMMPLMISAVQYSAVAGLLAVGGNRGLAVLDTNTNVCVHTFTRRISLLYTADPESHKKDFQRRLQHQASMRKDTLDPLSDSNYQHALQKMALLKKHSFPLIQTQPEHSTFADGEEEANDSNTVVTFLQLVQVPLDKDGVPVLTLWTATTSGHIAVYRVNKTGRNVQLESTGIIISRRSPVVSVFVLNHRGERQLTPYRLKEAHPHLVDALKMAFASAGITHSPFSYAVVTTKERIKCLAFPGSRDIGHHEPSLNGGAITHSSFFHCQGLPCLLNVTTTGDIFIHSLPKVQHLITVPYAPLQDSRALHTFQVSGDGQAVHFISPSEIQRLSVTRDDHLNYPNCLPNLFVDQPDPELPQASGLLGRVKGSGVRLDKDELFATSPSAVPSRFINRRDVENTGTQRSGIFSRAFSTKKRNSPQSERRRLLGQNQSEGHIQAAQTQPSPLRDTAQTLPTATAHQKFHPSSHTRPQDLSLHKSPPQLRKESIKEEDGESPAPSTPGTKAKVEKAALRWKSRAAEQRENPREKRPTNQFERTRQAAEERGRELTQLQQRSERMASEAAGFADVAALLMQKYKK